MTKITHSPTLAETAFGLKAANPIARMMAGFTGFAVAVTLILVTAIPVEADRGVCSTPVDAPVASCTAK